MHAEILERAHGQNGSYMGANASLLARLASLRACRGEKQLIKVSTMHARGREGTQVAMIAVGAYAIGNGARLFGGLVWRPWVWSRVWTPVRPGPFF
jgi:hypothetical protein